MRWIHAGVGGLVFATIALVAVTAVQSALGMPSVFMHQSICWNRPVQEP